MFKGHTKIELTDVNTGKKEVREDDNMFTQAIFNSLNNTWTQMLGGLGAINGWHLPLESKMLGGIALFGDNIAEDENITYFPKGNPVIGYAGTIASDGLDNMWGSRNLLESEEYNTDTKSVKYVWDFSTSQGNGTIKAVGIMDGSQADYYGIGAWHKKYNRRLDITSYFSQFGYRIAEWDGDIVVWMENGTGSVKINKSKFVMDKVTLNNTLGKSEVIETHTVSLPVSDMNYYYTYWKDGDDGYWYGFITMVNNSFNSTKSTYVYDIGIYGSNYLQVIRVSKTTYEMEYHNITIPNYYVQENTSNPIITDNYILVPVSNVQYFAYDNYNNVQKNKAAQINKNDWTVTIVDFKDSKQNAYTMKSLGDCSRQLFVGQFQNIKLPNGLYQMNDLIFDDDCNVVKQINNVIYDVTGMPATENKNSLYTLLCPYYLYSIATGNRDDYRPIALLSNKKKNIFLWVGHINGSYKAYIMPMNCQQLMTINNLSEPVTKTATQSMKITYTITDV